MIIWVSDDAETASGNFLTMASVRCWVIASILKFDLPAIRGAQGLERGDRSQASASTVGMHGRVGTESFDRDDPSDAIGAGMQRRGVHQPLVASNADTGRGIRLIHISLVARGDYVCPRVVRFHLRVASVDTDDAGYGRGRRAAGSWELQRVGG